MWARITEILLGIWMLISRFFFSYENLPITPLSDLIVGICLIIPASLSFIPRLNKLHLLEFFPLIWLFYVPFSYPTPFLPFALQNYVVVALLIFMFVIIPSRASDHPRPWEKFLKEKNLP